MNKCYLYHYFRLQDLGHLDTPVITINFIITIKIIRLEKVFVFFFQKDFLLVITVVCRITNFTLYLKFLYNEYGRGGGYES